ncbi:MAG: methylmalonyl Co-A mutase-associated GTPase MeaB [Nostocoides sp.]
MDSAAQIVAGDVRTTARAITGIENGDSAARQLISDLHPHIGEAQIIGITGPPGAGKSTLVAALIRQLRAQDRTVGVIAVDPSSPITGGAVLGDRDRLLDAVSGDDGVFIRSLASRGAAGGLATSVNDSVDILDAMGKDVIIVETVGVGQGEVEVASIAHTLVLVLVPGYGDALQAMKAGILEVADVIAVNKSDIAGANGARAELSDAGLVKRSPSGEESWTVPVLPVSALRNEGVDVLVNEIDRHYAHIGTTSWRSDIERLRRQAQFAGIVAERLKHLLGPGGASFGGARDGTHPWERADELIAHVLSGHTRSESEIHADEGKPQ